MTKNILTARQQQLLQRIGAEEKIADQFYLTGGTALAGFYLHHRYSEDLDFFSEKEIDVLPISTFISDLKKEFNIKKIDLQQTYNRNIFFLHFPREILKAEFTYFPFPRIKKGITSNNIEIDSITDIAVNKLFSIYQRTKARDYVDLFWICQKKKFTIKSLVKLARLKFDFHIDLLQLGTQFLKAQEAEDMPRMIAAVKPAAWKKFFHAEARKLKNDVISV